MYLKKVLIVTGCLLAVASCKKSVPDAELVAKVNGEGITKVEFEKAVERNLARYRGQGHSLPPGIEVRIKESVLRRLIDDNVIAQKAKTSGVAVTDEELGSKFEEHKKRFRTDQAFQDYLKRSNNTEENMKSDLRRNLLRDRVVEKLSGTVEVGEEDVKKYYEENQERFKEKEQIKVSRILVRVNHTATDAEKKKAAAEAKKFYGQAKKSGADFGALAKEHSKGPEASRNGELGWLTRGRMPPEFDKVAFDLEAGAVSKPVETKLGYEIIKVAEKKEERQRTLEEVQENIKNSLVARKRNEKRREVLRDLKKDAKVEQLAKFERPAPTPPTPGQAGAPGRPVPPPVARPGVPRPPQAPGAPGAATAPPAPPAPNAPAVPAAQPN